MCECGLLVLDDAKLELVLGKGIEPLTRCLQGSRSTTELDQQLAHHSGIEPETDSLEGYCSFLLS
jgi:hypothetical protein